MTTNKETGGALIPVQEVEGKQCVDARDLHEFLEVGKKFTDWIKDRISKYGFAQGDDYEVTLPQNGKRTRGGHNATDYLISIDMAKELSMVERNAKGKEARQYFIQCEERLREIAQPTLTKEQQILSVINMLQADVKALEAKVEEDAPKVEFHDVVTKSHSVCTMAVAANVAKLPYGRNTLYQNLRRDDVLMSGGKRHNLPKQRYIKQGLFTVDESKYEHPKTGEPIVTYMTHVTQKGIDWIIKNYGGEA